MLKRLLVCVILLMFAVPSLAAEPPSAEERGLGFINPNMPTSDELIYRAYLGLISWTLARGEYARNRDGSRMKYLRFTEVLQAPTQPATITGVPFGPPKIRKVYFQVIASSKVAMPATKDDIDSRVRIVVVETTRTSKFFKSLYYVGADTNLDGLPNSVKEWTAYKSLETKKVFKRGKEKTADVPKSAEIVDMTWNRWLAEFIKFYQLYALEDLGLWYENGPDFREALLKELAHETKESDSRSSFNFNPAGDTDIWPDGANAGCRPEGL